MLFPGTLVSRMRNRLAKRVFLLRQYEGTVKRVWGTEFVLRDMKEAREVLRREYDKLKEDLEAAKVVLEENRKKEDPDKTIQEHFERTIETKSREIEEWKKKIDLSDETIRDLNVQLSGYQENLEKLEKDIYNV